MMLPEPAAICKRMYLHERCCCCSGCKQPILALSSDYSAFTLRAIMLLTTLIEVQCSAGREAGAYAAQEEAAPNRAVCQ